MLDPLKLQKLGMQTLQNRLHYKLARLKDKMLLECIDLAHSSMTVEEINSAVHDSYKAIDIDALMAQMLDKATRY